MAGSPMLPPARSDMRRRAFVAGVGGLAVGAPLIGPPAAHARGDDPEGAAGGPARRATTVTSTIASAPVSGWTYRFASFFDFSTEGTGVRSWGGYGTYSTTSDYLWTSVDVPAGALVRDIEWYVYNASGSTYTCLNRLWEAGNGSLFTSLGDTQVPSGTGIRAVRTVVPSSTYGPYPNGIKVTLGLATPSSGSVQVNGVRVGMSNAGSLGTLAKPIRVYSTRAGGGKLRKGKTRTITLPPSTISPGVGAVLLHIRVDGVKKPGTLTVWPGDGARPGQTIGYAKNDAIIEALTVGISSARQLKLSSSQNAHVAVDLVGIVG